MVHGHGYLSHPAEDLRAFYRGVHRILFLPYAQGDRDASAARFRERMAGLGFGVDSLHESPDVRARQRLAEAEAVFVGGGNTFRLLDCVQRLGLIEPLRRRVREGMPYGGASAGSNLACPTLMTTNDMPIVQPASFEALGLIPFQINPHYVDPDPTSTHKGETREQRIAEFHELNAVPVLGLREGAHVRVEGERRVLGGLHGARLFRRGEAALELVAGNDLGFLF